MINLPKWDKLLKRIIFLSKDLRFEELQKVLEAYGYEMSAPRSGSSHRTFRKEGYSVVTIPKDKSIKIAYVEIVKDIIESEVEKKDEKRP